MQQSFIIDEYTVLPEELRCETTQQTNPFITYTYNRDEDWFWPEGLDIFLDPTPLEPEQICLVVSLGSITSEE